MAGEKVSDERLARLVLEEIDVARDTFELARQLSTALPIESFEDVVRAGGEKGVLQFRGHGLELARFADLIPTAIFPITTADKLVELCAVAVEQVPPSTGLDLTDPERAKRITRKLSTRALVSSGRIGPPGFVPRLGGGRLSQPEQRGEG